MKKYRDEICRLGQCANIEICKELCPPLRWINGKAKTKEILLSNVRKTKTLEYKNYNESLAELAEHTQNVRLQRQEKIIEILYNQANNRTKLIKLAILAGYSQTEIAHYMRISPARISQILQNSIRCGKM